MYVQTNGKPAPPLFFFQAEDGIRDCLLSRGLGDVYKRQLHEYLEPDERSETAYLSESDTILLDIASNVKIVSMGSVSYTHLTLPTILLV